MNLCLTITDFGKLFSLTLEVFHVTVFNFPGQFSKLLTFEKHQNFALANFVELV